MDIKDLASSLLSLSDLITISNRVLNGDKSPAITTKIIATNRGSFMVDLESIQQLAPMLGIGTGVVGAGVVGFVLRSIFGGVIGNASYQGLVHLRKRFLGKTPYEQIAQPDDTVKLLYHEKDGDKEKRAELAIPQSALQLSQSRQVIQSFDNMTKPLLKQGIDRMEFSSQDTQVGITKEEAVKFINDGTNVQSIDEQRVLSQKCVIIRLGFDNPKLKWRLDINGVPRFATIRDMDFWNQVQNRHPFAAKDVLLCDLTIRQTLFEDGTSKTEYLVDKVIEHSPGDKPPDLFSASDS